MMIEDYASVAVFPDCTLYQLNVICNDCRADGLSFVFRVYPLGLTQCPQCHGWNTKVAFGYYIPDSQSVRWLFRTLKHEEREE